MSRSDARADGQFDARFHAQFEELLLWRRDVRHFLSDAVDPLLLVRLLDLARLAPSVGFSQPARFVLVESPARRAAMRENFLRSNQAALADYIGATAALYAQLKLAGLNEAPIHLAVFCDEDTATGRGLGRRTMPEMLRYSVVAAVQNLWLALRMHGVGLGWVSILDPRQVVKDLDVPPTWALVAYCCIGYPKEVHDVPELERSGWERRKVASSAALIMR